MNSHRMPAGGRVDRARPLTFTFDGTAYTGYEGDTLASALLANGVRTVATSLAHGRPRGVYAAGVDEPNALVGLAPWAPAPDGRGTHGQGAPGQGAPGPGPYAPARPAEPMAQATVTELYDGLRAVSLRGKGRLDPDEPGDHGRHDTMHAHCDVLVVGAGPAGLTAARTAAATGARVVLLDEQPELGGSLLGTRERVADRPALEWVGRTAGELADRTETTVLTRTTALGCYDHNHVVAAERQAPAYGGGGRLWLIRARRVVFATGAHERPLLFADNDRPGVMLAGAARTYANRYAALPGRRAVVCTNNDSAYAAALELADAGLEIARIADARDEVPPYWAALCADRHIEVSAGHVAAGSRGGADGAVTAALLAARDADGAAPAAPEAVACDLLLVSGGWNPAVQLHTQSGGRTRYDERLCCHVPYEPDPRRRVAGAARGLVRLGDCLADGAAAGADAATDLGLTAGQTPRPPGAWEPEPVPPRWPLAPYGGDLGAHYVDLQRDATLAGIERAVGSGMRSVEHVKRYTTIGTAHDQGRTSGVTAAAATAAALGVPVAELGTTTHRPPYTPVPFALLAGRARGRLHDPVRTTPLHARHVARGAVFEDVGQWKRPRYYPLPGEDMAAAVDRECRAAREGVACMDVSTLGKIDIQGPDAAEFLNRVYTNGFAKLRVGSSRYGVMCTADGMVFDDGVTMRLAEDHFRMSTTTGNAAAVLDWLEEWLQTEWPDLRVFCTSVTEQWAGVAVAGPRARTVLARLAPELPLDNAEFPFMAWRDAEVAGLAARVARISFSGELAFEVYVSGWYGRALWDAVLDAGADEGITPYGTETMHVLRAEKGYVIVGQDTDGTVTPQDLGMDWVVSKRKDFIGRRSYTRPDTARTDRKHLVGLLPWDTRELLPEGGHITEDDPGERPATPVPSLGHVTSSYRSAALGRTFALALVRGGRERIGGTVHVPLGDRTVAAEVTEPVFYDREGSRRDG
ncbi:FAD-dependent oxidoreductase [Streptomyces armeniacus]|uniref:Sarcosine oxidase subunit alpha n=1 Tax=Streptomyces armeniacus TaxID=83291 RepID=A0A345XXI3_9ACTN|nr:2Fe-2S iron-sulfur cluster-binding protein [Streptomyces armeniacus]AXK36349.1 FAD-dependent oxidoreductase [Streptomyces armeniacus]